jgi:hypothetical protein
MNGSPGKKKNRWYAQRVALRIGIKKGNENEKRRDY